MSISSDASFRSSGREKGSFYFPELDGLRFFAFLLVFIHHTELFYMIPQLRFLHDFGWAGVDLFFALSAFLFTKLLLVELQVSGTISFTRFYMRRIFRIWPVYYLYVAISLLLFTIGAHNVLTGEAGLRLIGLLTFTDNIFSAISGYNPIPLVGHLWTIGYEEQFYIFIPLLISMLARFSVKSRLLFLAAASLVFFAVRAVMILYRVPHPAIWVLPVTHFESIALGMVIGFGGMDLLAGKIRPMLLFAAGVTFFCLMCLLPPIQTVSFLLFATYALTGLSTALVLQSVISSDRLKRILSTRALVYLGKRSYGLYVYHFFGIELANRVLAFLPEMPVPDAFSFALSMLFTVMMSIVSYRVVERPFLELKKRFEVVASRPV
jgi:peptidoglycan/LPS O-acetylase OafA/YrhL